MLDLAHQRAVDCINEAFVAAKDRWDKHHTPSPIQVGDQVMISTKHFNFKDPHPKLHDQFAGPFPVTELIGPNAIRVQLHAPYFVECLA
ncbi:RNA-directed DNA polymerase [Atractiella rhizophila]|nr:RNA-directed DNA polymerase [Atractiella rhizophila]